MRKRAKGHSKGTRQEGNQENERGLDMDFNLSTIVYNQLHEDLGYMQQVREEQEHEGKAYDYRGFSIEPEGFWPDSWDVWIDVWT